MNRYQIINLETEERVCGFLSNASDWEGLLYHAKGYSGENLPWQWVLQQEIFGEWKSIMIERSSPEYEEYKKNLNWIKRFFGYYLSFEDFVDTK